MKVKELIEQLKVIDGELEVWVDNDGRLEEALIIKITKNGHWKDPYDVILIR